MFYIVFQPYCFGGRLVNFEIFLPFPVHSFQNASLLMIIITGHGE